MLCARCGHEAADAFKFCPECGAPAAVPAAAREQRKVVTVLFCDVTGSTELGERLDPEALRALLARYFERMKAIVETHGGTVEKFIGDAVMAVFGVPTLHEDDALRAVRAAVEMRDALPGLGIAGRIGVATGEVVTGTEERLATGDAVTVAARLEQAAAPGEVLLGAETLRLVRDAVEVEPVEPLALKGKAEPVPAYRLLAVTGEPGRRNAAPMVGRERQLRLLADAFAGVRDDRACHLFTILGAAGVGKSRLASEFARGVDAVVVGGRCPSYGEGVAYRPVVEVLRQLGRPPTDPAAASAVRVVLGESEEPTTPEEIAWAVRRTLEDAAQERPLVVVWDDLHWGDETLLDLVEHVADWSRDAPILLVCVARPELLDRRPTWAGGKLNATTVLLRPLGAAETDELIERLGDVDAQLRARIRDAAEGNPLFVEEMLALARDARGEVAVPPSIQALIAARLDQLDPSERAVLERGAVEGRLFHRGAVEALSDGEPQVPVLLQALVRRELVRPDRPLLPGEEAFRFRQTLIRDAAYEALPKAVRAELHERLAAWIEERAADLAERDELLGYHLERACRYRAELGTPDEALARRAAALLAAAGERAMAQMNARAAVPLLERSLALLPEPEQPVETVLVLAFATFHARGSAAAAALTASAVERAVAVGDRRGEQLASLWLLLARVFAGEPVEDELDARIDEALSSSDDEVLACAWLARANVEQQRCRFAAAAAALERCVEHAGRAGSRFYQSIATGGPGLDVIGAVPADEILASWPVERAERSTAPVVLSYVARALAMRGRFDEARRLHAEARSRLEQQGLALQAAALGQAAYEIETLAEDHAAAARLARESCERLEQLDAASFLSTQAPQLALALLELGRDDEAWEWAEKGRAVAGPGDVITHVYWRRAEAVVLARRGAFEEAERLAREAVDGVAATDMLLEQGFAGWTLAEVLELAGRPDEAGAALAEAAARFAQKGAVPAVARAQARLAELRTAAAR